MLIMNADRRRPVRTIGILGSVSGRESFRSRRPNTVTRLWSARSAIAQARSLPTTRELKFPAHLWFEWLLDVLAFFSISAALPVDREGKVQFQSCEIDRRADMTVIVMARETGPRGDEIAAAIAERLDLELVSRKDLARAVAHGLRLDEAAVQRVVDGSASWLERWTIDRHRLCQRMGEEAVRLAARQNVLIQDCGAAQLLRPVMHVISVLCGPPRELGLALGRSGLASARPVRT